MNLIDAFKSFLGKRETNGKNRSQVIDTLNKWVGVPLGSPYCATTLSYCLDQCAKVNGDESPKPKTASSYQFRKWFENKGQLSWSADDLLRWAGAFGGWTNPDLHGHVFLIEKRYTAWWSLKNRNRVVALGTLEANTGPDGGRDGDGFYRRKRKVTEKNFWYCRTDDVPGGRYWPVKKSV